MTDHPLGNAAGAEHSAVAPAAAPAAAPIVRFRNPSKHYVRGDQAVNYHLGTWHHPLRVLDRPGRFAVLMWSTGVKADDEEWSTLPEPVTITA